MLILVTEMLEPIIYRLIRAAGKRVLHFILFSIFWSRSLTYMDVPCILFFFF